MIKNGIIFRHRTAIKRSLLSVPVKNLLRAGLINSKTSFLDYGCGRGDDVKFLNEFDYPAIGWDPYFSPEPSQLQNCDIVNLGFVINVIEDKQERLETLKKAFELTNQCLSVAVMPHCKNTGTILPYKDGQLTKRQTFQKYYSQEELKTYLSQNLKGIPVSVAPGVFFVFKNKKIGHLFKTYLTFIRKIWFKKFTLMP